MCYDLAKGYAIHYNVRFIQSLKSLLEFIYEVCTSQVVINDTEGDHPTVQFTTNSYFVDEGASHVNVLIQRSGDLTNGSTVICFTQDNSAKAGEDYYERRKRKNSSKIKFRPGEKVHFVK